MHMPVTVIKCPDNHKFLQLLLLLLLPLQVAEEVKGVIEEVLNRAQECPATIDLVETVAQLVYMNSSRAVVVAVLAKQRRNHHLVLVWLLLLLL
jgi:hypothetical protein